MDECRSVILRSWPHGEPQAENFETRSGPVPAPGPGEVLTRTLWLSIDPYMRTRMRDGTSYAAPTLPGEVMTGETVGQVVASGDPRFTPGQVVSGARGWSSHLVSPAEALVAVPPGVPPATYLGVLGMPGTTAYAGMFRIGQVKPGETVVVSAASGAVGSVAGQLAKRAGARVVGVAGGMEKAAFVRDALGFDACIDHRAADDLGAALSANCPDGIDVYFENVGGALQHAVFPLLNPFGRVIMCGMAAEYNDPTPRPGPSLGTTFLKRLRIEGFICGDHPENFAVWRALATPWVLDGSLRYRETVVEGLENAPAALAGLLRGENFGKLLVRVAA